MLIRSVLSFVLSLILVLQIFSVTQFGIPGNGSIYSHSAFAQISGSSQPSYTPYQNNNASFSVEYPSNWTYSEKTQGGRMTASFLPYQNSATLVQLFYDKTTSYVGTDQQKLQHLPQIISTICSGATIATNGLSCSGFQYKTGMAQYRGIPAYFMESIMMEKFSDGSSREQDMAQLLVIIQNSDYGILVSCPKVDCNSYHAQINHFLTSLNIYSIATPTNATTPSIQATSNNIPIWIKNTAKWWSQGSLTDDDFVKGIQYLIQQGIIVVPTTQVISQSSQTIPSWVKNTAKWWSEGQVTDSDFVQGIQYLVQNGIIVTQNIEQAQTGVTDQQGMVTLQIKGQNVPFRLVDSTTGLPLIWFDVSFALDPKTQSVGTLLIIDPNKNYPLQVVMLEGSSSNSNIPTSWENNFIPNASAESISSIAVEVFKDPRTAGSILLVTLLPEVGAEAGDLVNNMYESLALAAKAADKNGLLPVSDYLEKHGFMTGTQSFEKATEKIHEETAGAAVRDAIFLAGSPSKHLEKALLGATFGSTINLMTTKMDISTVSGCDPQTQDIKFVQIGFTRIYSCTSNKAFGLVKYNPPSESEHVSLDLVSKANQGFSEKIQTDKGQSVPVPADDYSVTVSAPGKNPTTEDVTVTPNQITDVTAVPQPIPNNGNPQITTTITPARNLSGTWSGTFSMTDTTSDGCTFSGNFMLSLSQNGNDLSGIISFSGAQSPQLSENPYCTWSQPDFSFQGGQVSSSSFSFSSSDQGGLDAKGSFTTDLIRGTFNECSDGSCASGTFTGIRHR